MSGRVEIKQNEIWFTVNDKTKSDYISIMENKDNMSVCLIFAYIPYLLCIFHNCECIIFYLYTLFVICMF